MRAMAGAAPDRAQLLLELIRDVTSTLDLQEVLDRSLAAVRRVIEFDGGSIQLIDGGALRMVAAVPAATARMRPSIPGPTPKVGRRRRPRASAATSRPR